MTACVHDLSRTGSASRVPAFGGPVLEWALVPISPLASQSSVLKGSRIPADGVVLVTRGQAPSRSITEQVDSTVGVYFVGTHGTGAPECFPQVNFRVTIVSEPPWVQGSDY